MRFVAVGILLCTCMWIVSPQAHNQERISLGVIIVYNVSTQLNVVSHLLCAKEVFRRY